MAKFHAKDHWWDDYSNIVLLVDYLADMNWSGKEIADVVEKPWHFTTEYEEAVENLNEETEQPTNE